MDYNTLLVVRNTAGCENRREGGGSRKTLAKLKREEKVLVRQGMGNGTKYKKRMN